MKNFFNALAIAAITCGILLAEYVTITWTGWDMIHPIVHCILLILFAKHLWK